MNSSFQILLCIDLHLFMWCIFIIKCEIYHIKRRTNNEKLVWCIGFISLLGLWGLIGDEPLFLSFFTFIAFFEYFWVTPDGSNPLAAGTALGFGISIAVFAISTFILETKERINAKND